MFGPLHDKHFGQQDKIPTCTFLIQAQFKGLTIEKIGQVRLLDVQGKIRQKVLISNQIELHNPQEKYNGSYVVYLI
ncbi:unnamed protein product [Paramecium octaurelia]|uniref:Uncharacterized protein n=1 Tax=Paramecium octaurelia TaxID=43137 RepID=A0A8S1T335_PAROT|nr:unnamed protein product [Paramecium octaurelia]